MLSRKPEWPELFHEFLLSRASRPFTWGSNDCATFSADGIAAMTGTDPLADLRGYLTEAEAMQRISDVTGASTMEDAVVWIAAKYGLTERPHILTAQRGDLVLYRNGGSLAASLVHLNGRDIVSPGAKGFSRMPLTSAHRVWTY